MMAGYQAKSRPGINALLIRTLVLSPRGKIYQSSPCCEPRRTANNEVPIEFPIEVPFEGFTRNLSTTPCTAVSQPELIRAAATASCSSPPPTSSANFPRPISLVQLSSAACAGSWSGEIIASCTAVQKPWDIEQTYIRQVTLTSPAWRADVWSCQLAKALCDGLAKAWQYLGKAVLRPLPTLPARYRRSVDSGHLWPVQ